MVLYDAVMILKSVPAAWIGGGDGEGGDIATPRMRSSESMRSGNGSADSAETT